MPGEESYLIIGGCGFLGRWIVDQLVERGETKVAVFDIVQRHFDNNITFFTGDLSNAADVENAIVKSGATSIIHTASPHYTAPADILERVNVTGTSNVVDMCLKHNVRKLVYTSSGAVYLDGIHQLISADERLDYAEKPLDVYNTTKIEAEKIVLNANDRSGEGLLTCCIRPCGIFGPGDQNNIKQWHRVVLNGQTKWQIGDNMNINDFTFVGNVARAHILASDRLAESYPCDRFRDPLPSIDLSVGERRVPTSEARPLGPNTSPSEKDLEVAKRFASKEYDPNDLRPVLRNRMDHFSEQSNLEDESASVPVAGQAYFVTNGEPVYFWDFARTVWKHFGPLPTSYWVLPVALGYIVGLLSETFAKISGRQPGMTRYNISQVVQNRYFSIEKSRRLLGYEPTVGIQEGIQLMADWYKEELAKKGEPESKKSR
ncbi:C-3 sterol dehydrogenase [Kockovaella imperatae]|uniref:C-3 sterol dehydrogenase n=1 Tax=Kockovaella imperatae TaxID=4999 RepID=A0A1Y1ULC6_9TREE|nr:C-3 sterol dehydrogenase [Kockovaella imperatae]ORX38841.1 C-3 sterol dehydrogenase [Kockovaella imperatae]